MLERISKFFAFFSKRFLRVLVLMILFSIGYYFTISTVWSTFGTAVFSILYGVFAIIVAASLVIISLNFLSIDCRRVQPGIIELVSVIMLLIIVATIYFTTPFSPELFFKLVAVVVIHLGFHLFLHQKITYLNTRTNTSLWGIASHGVVLFALLFALGLSLFMGVELTKAPMQCNTFYGQLQNIANTPIDALQDGSESVLNWSQQSLGEIIDNTSTRPGGFWENIIDSPYITQLQEDQQLVRQSFCDMIVTILHERVGQGMGIVAVIIILFVLFSPLLTLWFRVTQVIIWFLFLLLRSIGVYKWKDQEITVKQLE